MTRRYSQELKEEIISLYKEGYGSTIISKKLSISKAHTARIINRYLAYGSAGLLPMPKIKTTGEFRCKVILTLNKNKLSLERTALKYGISERSVFSWLKKYKEGGYRLLAKDNFKHKATNAMGRPCKKEPQTELEKLQYELELLRTENALLKKVKALVEQRESQRQKNGLKPSKN